MSLVALHEAAYNPTVLAEELDCNFQEIADRIPYEAKMGASGMISLEHKELGVGRLEVRYIGKFMMELAIVSEANPMLGFIKEYNLRDYYKVPGGRLQEVAPTAPGDLIDCPVPLFQLAFLVDGVTKGYLDSVVAHDQAA